jgi:hypothetical protein
LALEGSSTRIFTNEGRVDVMTAEQLAVIAGAILSLAFSYIPGLKNRYEPLSEEVKRLVMLGLLVLVVAGVFGLACSRFGVYLGIAIACDEPGLVGLVWSLVLAVMANQSTYLITPKLRKV